MTKALAVNSEEIESGLPATLEQTSLAVSLARAEIDQQITTSRALPRSIQRAISNITTLATIDEETAAECIYALPRGGKTIRGPSIRFAEILASQWGNCRIGARVVHVDKFEGYVEAEGVFHDLETNVAQTARVRRTIQAKRGKGIDNDMIQLAGAAACSIARRNAILAGVPKGVARKGYLAVENVIRGEAKTLTERRDLALTAFAKLGVNHDRIFAALEVSGPDDITLDHLMTLTGARSAIKNGEATIDELFPIAAQKTKESQSKTLTDRLASLAREESFDPETGEIIEHETGADVGGHSASTGHGEGDVDKALDESNAVANSQESAQEIALSAARAATMDGRKAFDVYYRSLDDAQRDLLNGHVKGLLEAADKADGKK